MLVEMELSGLDHQEDRANFIYYLKKFSIEISVYSFSGLIW